MDAGSLDGADDGDGLAAELGDGYGDVGLLEIFLEALLDLLFQFVGGEAGGLEAADHRQVDVAAHVDADGLVADFIHVGDLDGDLVVCAENVVGGRVLTLGGGGGDAASDGLRRGRGSRRSWRLLRASNHHERNEGNQYVESQLTIPFETRSTSIP